MKSVDVIKVQVALVAVALVVSCQQSPGTRALGVEQRNKCISNLRQIDGAKEAAALQAGLNERQTVSAELIIKYGGGPLYCPSGGRYTVGVVGEIPRCTIRGHSIGVEGFDKSAISIDGSIVEER